MAANNFYKFIKDEIEKGQYLLEYMKNKLEKAYARDLVTAEQYDELLALAKTSVDSTYIEEVTLQSLQDKMIGLELDLSNVNLALIDLTEYVYTNVLPLE